MLNVRRSFRRFYVFVVFVRRVARELSTRLVMDGLMISCEDRLGFDPRARD